MLTVNFISTQRLQQLRYRRLGQNLTRGICFAAAAMVAYTAFGVFSLRRTEQAISQTNFEKVAFQQQALDVQKLRIQIAALTPRVALVNENNRRLDHLRYLYVQVARSTPDTVRLESVDLAAATVGANRTMQILGKGDNAFSISKMVMALNSQPGFSQVTMGQVTLTTPHEATMDVKMDVKPLPEDEQSANPATPTTPGQAS